VPIIIIIIIIISAIVTNSIYNIKFNFKSTCIYGKLNKHCTYLHEPKAFFESMQMQMQLTSNYKQDNSSILVSTNVKHEIQQILRQWVTWKKVDQT